MKKRVFGRLNCNMFGRICFLQPRYWAYLVTSRLYKSQRKLDALADHFKWSLMHVTHLTSGNSSQESLVRLQTSRHTGGNTE